MQREDVLILDNLRAHHDPKLRPLCAKFAVQVPIFHLIHTISIPLSLAGLFKNSTYASMLLGAATPCDALRSALGIESSRTTAGSGFGMQDTRSTEVIGGVKASLRSADFNSTRVLLGKQTNAYVPATLLDP